MKLNEVLQKIEMIKQRELLNLTSLTREELQYLIDREPLVRKIGSTTVIVALTEKSVDRLTRLAGTGFFDAYANRVEMKEHGTALFIVLYECEISKHEMKSFLKVVREG